MMDHRGSPFMAAPSEAALAESKVILGDGKAVVGTGGRAMLSRNVRIHNRRTSVRLEPAMWAALNEIATAEQCTIHDLCGAVYDLKEEGVSFTAALRVFLMEYYRTVASVSPHVSSVKKLINTPPDRSGAILWHKATG